jgi:hypothetical protein
LINNNRTIAKTECKTSITRDLRILKRRYRIPRDKIIAPISKNKENSDILGNIRTTLIKNSRKLERFLLLAQEK